MALKPCRECSKEISIEAITCPHCGAPNPHGQSVIEPPESKGTNTQGETKGEKLAGLVVGTWLGLGCLIPAGVVLCLTGIGALIGIPLIIAGIVAPIVGLVSSIKGPCPYCGSAVTTSKSSQGVTCRACKKRVVVRDRKFYRVE
jgi:DNA-directed RNA polymerase subunit RPC12/RpoP